MSNRSVQQADLAALQAAYPHLFSVRWATRAKAVGLVLSVLGLFIFGLIWLGFSPMAIIHGAERLRIILGLMFPPSAGELFPTYVKALAQTLAIAFLGTLLASLIAFPLSLLAARNVVNQGVVHFFARRWFDAIRGVDTLIWALVFINVVGLGPFAGILAVAMSDVGSFGKLFSEVIETADRKPVEGIVSTGGSRSHRLRFGIVPQVLPIFLSQVLYYFESNTRSATVIGIVGAGGIGLYLSNEINQQNWDHVSFIILMILITVATIDFVSARIRQLIYSPK
ncbi:MAG: phosphonate ABC transporter, permease protein PhnE [Alphaproteobacteria bacterium]|nr:phosphonate ABC transporter, permease protein PhnE [Alphaproteobacteria bacterium]